MLQEHEWMGMGPPAYGGQARGGYKLIVRLALGARAGRHCGLMVACLALPSSAGGQVPGQRLAGTGDPVPGHANVQFQEVALPQLSGDWVIALGRSQNQAGVYAWNGVSGFEVVGLGENPPGVPAGSEISLEGYDIGEGGLAAFSVAWDGPGGLGAGVWAWQGGQLTKIIQTGEVATGSAEPFLYPIRIRVRGEDVYVQAHEGTDVSSGTYRIYHWSPHGSGVESIIAPPDNYAIQTFWPYADRLYVHGDTAPSDPRLWSFDLVGGDMRVEFTFPPPFPGSPAGTEWLPRGGIHAPYFMAEAATDPFMWGFFRLSSSGLVEQVFGPGGIDPTTNLPYSSFGPAAHSEDNVALSFGGPVGRRLVVWEWPDSYHFIAGANVDYSGSEVLYIETLFGGLDQGRIAFSLVRANGDIAVWIASFGNTGEPVVEVPGASVGGLALLAVAVGLGGMLSLKARPVGRRL